MDKNTKCTRIIYYLGLLSIYTMLCMSYPGTRKNEIFSILLPKEIIKIAYTYCKKKKWIPHLRLSLFNGRIPLASKAFERPKHLTDVM